MTERETLIKIQDNGEILVLLDGRRLRVRPGDFPKSRSWLPMEELEISDDSSDPMFTVKIRNIEEREEILAMWG
ncbi:MAG: hypothetical protein A2Y65_09760 [Deltaproteobacteria bacterium RBG_13_52_11]|nr:MAG: hypothetical protein A2Y65_09760 [Deltaproteobacteria bacterium RBG_13_52_11]